MNTPCGLLSPCIAYSVVFFLAATSTFAAPRSPLPPMPELVRVSFSEQFDAAFHAGRREQELILSNGKLVESFSGHALQRAGTVVPFVIDGVQNGHTNIFPSGAVRLWVRPYWSSAATGAGNGPGHVAQVLEMSGFGKGQSAPVWSLQINADGSVMTLLGAGEKESGVLLKTEIAWQAGEWHQVVLNYTEKETALVLDGEFVADGAGVLAVPPQAAALAVASSLAGTDSFEGEIEEVFCFARPLTMAFHWLAYKDVVRLGPISAEEMAYRAELGEKSKAAKALQAKEAEDSGGGGMMLRMSGPSVECITNGPVYLTNVLVTVSTNDSWTIYFDIMGGTNEVLYDIFATPEISGGDITNSIWTWRETGRTCETHYFTNQPTNQTFYILTVPGADRDGDSLYDGWEWKYFGTLAQPPDGDFDNDGVSNGQEYTNHTDPNSIRFDVHFDNLRISANVATGAVTVLKGFPEKMAVLVGETNLATATWIPYSSSVICNLGSVDGSHDIWLGLKGHGETSEQTWNGWQLTRDTVAPLIVITNPTVTTLSQPLLQFKGYSPEPLMELRYDLTNALGSLTNQEGYVTRQFVDPNTLQLTTNWFDCVDLELTNGLNTITLYATDRAGNVSTNVYGYVLDYTGDPNPPVLTVHWPQDGTQISGNSFTFRGWLDDATATVAAEIVATNGVTNVVSGLVERDGLLWAEDLPLAGGTNVLTLTMTDAAGNVSVTNLSVVKSDFILVMNPVSESLWQATVNVSGTASDSSYAVWVNGVQATVYVDGTWSASQVPVNDGGTASFVVTAYAPGEPQP